MRLDRGTRFQGESWVYRHTGTPGEQSYLAALLSETQRFGSDRPAQGRLYRRGYADGIPFHPWYKTRPVRR